MSKKIIIRLTEGQLADVVANNIIGSSSELIKSFLKGLSGDKSEKTDTSSKDITSTGGDFPTLNLNDSKDYKAYEKIADKFISSRSSNLLGIRGSMLANAAKSSFNKFGKYVPVELALAQLAQEGGFSSDSNSRPIRTKNPFNVGNIDSGKNVTHGSVQNGIQTYYDLIAKNYLTGEKTASDLLSNFVNTSGRRYATDRKYENSLSKIANQINSLGQPIYASLEKGTTGLA